MPSLVQFNSSGSVVKNWELSNSVLMFGRGQAATAQIDDTKMSREHFSVTFENGRYYVADNNSTNGTLVNGRRLTQREQLHGNDRIKAGDTQFLFQVGTATMLNQVQVAAGNSFKSELKNIYDKVKR